MDRIPTQIQPLSPLELFVEWNTGEKFSVPYIELRYHCPCAGCVDEMTGQRTLRRESLQPTVRPNGVELVGSYALHFAWSDGHTTGMYGFDRLWELCEAFGKKLGMSESHAQA